MAGKIINNLYKIERTDMVDYDEFDADIICAPNEEVALKLSNVGGYPGVIVTHIGESYLETGEILASFNAG